MFEQIASLAFACVLFSVMIVAACEHEMTFRKFVKSTGLGLVAAFVLWQPLAAFAQTAPLTPPMDLPPGLTITTVGEPFIQAPSFLPVWLAPWWNWIATPAVAFWFMTHLRAWIPVLGQLGWLTKIGDVLIAGNYGAAANKN